METEKLNRIGPTALDVLLQAFAISRNHLDRAVTPLLADQRVIAVDSIPELLKLDHPWIQEYFNGPRGRAAKDSQERADRSGRADANCVDKPAGSKA